MGASLSNMHVRTDSQKNVCDALRKILSIRAYVSPVQDGWVSVFDEVSNSLDEEEITKLARELSVKLCTVVLACSVYDSDVMSYYYYENGEQLDYYNSCPDYFNPADENEFNRTQGNAPLLLKFAQPGANVEDIEKALFRQEIRDVEELEESDYALAEHQLQALFTLLHINENYASIGFHDFFEEDIKSVIKNKSKFKLIARRGALKKIDELFHSIETGNLEKLRELINSGLSPNTKTNDRLREPALGKAIAKGNFEMVKFLIESGADVLEKRIFSWYSTDNIDIVRILIESGADINQGLLRACFDGNPTIIEMFLNNGADINYIDPENGYTPLHTAINGYNNSKHPSSIRIAGDNSKKRLENVKFLLEKGAQVNININIKSSMLQRISSYTILMCSEHIEIAELLLNHGARINDINKNGNTAMIDHSHYAHKEMVIFLLSKGADIFIRNSQNLTAKLVVQEKLKEFLEGAKGEYVDKFKEIFNILEKAERGQP